MQNQVGACSPEDTGRGQLPHISFFLGVCLASDPRKTISLSVGLVPEGTPGPPQEPRGSMVSPLSESETGKGCPRTQAPGRRTERTGLFTMEL